MNQTDLTELPLLSSDMEDASSGREPRALPLALQERPLAFQHPPLHLHRR